MGVGEGGKGKEREFFSALHLLHFVLLVLWGVGWGQKRRGGRGRTKESCFFFFFGQEKILCFCSFQKLPDPQRRHLPSSSPPFSLLCFPFPLFFSLFPAPSHLPSKTLQNFHLYGNCIQIWKPPYCRLPQSLLPSLFPLPSPLLPLPYPLQHPFHSFFPLPPSFPPPHLSPLLPFC